jgi:beta-glucanase (GH16 family)
MHKTAIILSAFLSVPLWAIPTSKIPIPPGYTNVIFLDDFSTQTPGSLPNSTKWSIDLGTSYPGGPSNWGTGEVQSYTAAPSNLAINAAGNLQITPRKNGISWTSARIETTESQDFFCPPGGKIWVEASIRLPDTPPAQMAGIWPAFWMLGSSFRPTRSGWPGIGEIDILELVNNQPIHQTIHCGVVNGGPCQEPSGLTTVRNIKFGEFSTFAVEIDRTVAAEEMISFRLNGEVTWTLRSPDFPDRAGWEAVAHTPKMILLNVAVGGAFPDALAGFRTPNDVTMDGDGAAMEVAYVVVYSG